METTGIRGLEGFTGLLLRDLKLRLPIMGI